MAEVEFAIFSGNYLDTTTMLDSVTAIKKSVHNLPEGRVLKGVIFSGIYGFY